MADRSRRAGEPGFLSDLAVRRDLTGPEFADDFDDGALEGEVQFTLSNGAK